jgi:hypothetical protein
MHTLVLDMDIIMFEVLSFHKGPLVLSIVYNHLMCNLILVGFSSTWIWA